MSNYKTIHVYADWLKTPVAAHIGTLHIDHLRGKEVVSFEYCKNWLLLEYPHILDPHLRFGSGFIYPPANKENFGLFMDSCPDRWGRQLMDKRESVLSRIEKRTERHLFESDYLLGVFDGGRMGAIRFKTEANGDFLNNDMGMASPHWTSLESLELACNHIEAEEGDDPESLKWINILVNPGSSLGGARPKASVLDSKQHLWIAKFPSIHDRIDKGAWEAVVNELAEMAGINVAECFTQKLTGRHHTYLTKRFDRTDEGQRIHF
jgi:serine/threonine-protein kinase HipA